MCVKQAVKRTETKEEEEETMKQRRLTGNLRGNGFGVY